MPHLHSVRLQIPEGEDRMRRAAPAYLAAAQDLRDNAGQWQVYESTGNCVILAGPGSGKTKTITVKIARLLEEQVHRPRRIACITYSNACVGELRSRLSRLGCDDDSRLLVSTVHSFCLTELVSPFARIAGLGLPDPLLVASPQHARQLFDEACVGLLGHTMGYSFNADCEKLRRTVLDRESKEWNGWNADKTRAVIAYETLLAEKGLIDFDGLVLASVELVENHAWIRCALRAKFPVIVIDEYQDLGLPLHRVVLALLRARVRIIAVGDPDQSIFGFTGAKPRLLKSLATHPGVEGVSLKLNYRCGNRIIAASSGLLEHPPAYSAHDDRDGNVFIYELKYDINEQARRTLKDLLPALLKQNPSWKPGDIAFLYRSKNEGNVIASAADKLGLRYFRRDNGSPIKHSRLIDWLTDAAKWCAGGWKTGEVQLSHLLKSWRRLQSSLVREADMLAARKDVIAALFSLRTGDMPLEQWLETMYSTVLEAMLKREPGLADEEDNLAELAVAVEKGGVLQDYTVEIFGNQGKSPDQINFITLHSAKGLEFEAVIMIGLEEGVFPDHRHKGDDLEEDWRLFYVGLTRAKNQVHLAFDRKESPLISAVRDSTR